MTSESLQLVKRVNNEMNDISSRTPCIGFIESSSIARGIEATDAMMKMADVELLMTTIIPRGKYLIMIGGRVADVESALRAGLSSAGDAVLDHFIIQNVHPELPPAIKGRVKVERIEAVGIIETKEVASAIYAGDAAVKSANIKLIEARNQPGEKVWSCSDGRSRRGSNRCRGGSREHQKRGDADLTGCHSIRARSAVKEPDS